MNKAKWKKRISLAIDALRGVPLTVDLPLAPLVVERPQIQTVGARFEMALPEADMISPENVKRISERKLSEKLIKGLSQSGAVQIFQTRSAVAVIFEARIRAVLPREED